MTAVPVIIPETKDLPSDTAGKGGANSPGQLAIPHTAGKQFRDPRHPTYLHTGSYHFQVTGDP